MGEFSTGKNFINLKFKDKIEANQFRKSIEEKIIELKLKWKVGSKFVEGINQTTGTPAYKGFNGLPEGNKLILTSDASRILRRSQSFCEGGEIEKQIFVENFLNIEPETENEVEMESIESNGKEGSTAIRSEQHTTKENKWNILRKRMTLTVKKDYNTLPSSPTNFKHVSHVGWNPNRFGHPVHHSGLASTKEEAITNNEKLEIKLLAPIGAPATNILMEDVKNSDERILKKFAKSTKLSPDDSEYHKISNFFKSEECLNSATSEKNEQMIKNVNILKDSSNEISKNNITKEDSFEEISDHGSHRLQRSRSGSQPKQADLDWENTLGNLRKSIASISGPRLKQSDESSLDITP